ncbi:1-deoxy-D-xylulose-5-phosphate synthase [Massilioclostridium coli]|uniref:1-deoxy-D-xylulose-5-phosphate synthase n=1 Tax=Massilioclostridium coli TaxID=1870991 RepID=UPI00085BE215|nr:1-deoxy-D-xylulose-5-phosphate synthase [Massilioclostridium coli]
MNQNSLLSRINSPRDLDQLTDAELKRLCAEIRTCIIQTVSKTGGHLASNLGVVELTVALHRAFESPKDKIVWDVGHQCYTHKLLTGRREQFSTLRQENGISGFPRPYESEHDSFMAGHSTNSISAACGIARAELLKGSNRSVIAVIGDGAFTGGMAYEALNNAAGLHNLIVILNYNEMSISKTVGSFARYLANLRSEPTYLKTKSSLENILDHTPVVGKGLKKVLSSSKKGIKNMLYHSNFFTDLGFAYLGPVDGHNLEELSRAMNWAKNADKPALIQVFTTKGKGYSKAEQNPGAYHGVSNFDIEQGNPDFIEEDSFSTAFGKELERIGRMDKKVCAVTAAMKYGTGLQYFSSTCRDRFFDVGIAEEHAVTFCSGLACNGMRPVFAVYSTFLQRGYDQIIHDAAISRNHVVLAVDRAGIVGNDGETHQGIFDAAYLSHIPGVTVYSPADYEETCIFLKKALYEIDGVVAVRYPRGSEPKLPEFQEKNTDYQWIGEGNCLIVTYGRISADAIQAAQKLGEVCPTAVLKLNRISPLPEEAVKKASQYQRIFFFEEGIRLGGIGEHFLNALNQYGFQGSYTLTAIDHFIPQASVESSLKQLHLDRDGMIKTIVEQINEV